MQFLCNNGSMKTTTELNKKWWYRTIKVVYIIFTTFAYLLALGGIVGAFITIKENKEDYSNKIAINAERTVFIEELMAQGSTTAQVTSAIKNKYQRGGILRLTQDEMRIIYGENSIQKFEESIDNQLKPNTPSTYNWLFLIIPLSILLAWLLTSLIKWIFFYIILGTIKPSKTN